MNQEIYKRLRKISERLKKEYHIAPTNERFFERIATVLRIIRDLKKGFPIDPIVLTAEEVEKRIKIDDQFIQEIIDEGIYL